MLQPRTYPKLIGRALVLEPDPFAVLAQDDEPVAEGLLLTVCVGVVVGAARALGGLLLSASLPPALSVQAIVQHAMQSLEGAGAGLAARLLSGVWQALRFLWGYDTGWARLFPLVWEPFLLLVQWLVVGVMLFVIGRALGGSGSLSQVLGAAALVCAPSVLLIVRVLPFAAPLPLLVVAWGALMLYRAAQLSLELSWQRAAVAATVTLVLALFLWLVALVAVGGLFLVW